MCRLTPTEHRRVDLQIPITILTEGPWNGMAAPASPPSWAAIVAITTKSAPKAASRARLPPNGYTQTLPSLYKWLPAIHDITSGNNGRYRPSPAMISSPAAAVLLSISSCSI